jgi:hypothetical protein
MQWLLLACVLVLVGAGWAYINRRHGQYPKHVDAQEATPRQIIAETRARKRKGRRADVTSSTDTTAETTSTTTTDPVTELIMPANNTLENIEVKSDSTAAATTTTIATEKSATQFDEVRSPLLFVAVLL